MNKDIGTNTPPEAGKFGNVSGEKSEKPVEINRIEIIDHTVTGAGRQVIKWTSYPFKVEFNYQDNNRTLKIFLTNGDGSYIPWPIEEGEDASPE